MKNKIAILTLGIALAIPYGLYANNGAAHNHDNHQTTESTAKVASTLKGKIIGLTCYLQHGSIGSSHKTCARECAEKGLPLGFMATDGTLYQIMGSGHLDLKTVNGNLLNYIEENVVIMGQTFEKNGYHAVIIEKIKKE